MATKIANELKQHRDFANRPNRGSRGIGRGPENFEARGEGEYLRHGGGQGTGANGKRNFASGGGESPAQPSKVRARLVEAAGVFGYPSRVFFFLKGFPQESSFKMSASEFSFFISLRTCPTAPGPKAGMEYILI